MSEKTKRVHLALGDAMKVGDLLRQHLNKIEGTDLWKYAEGWNDNNIAVMVGGTASAANVARVRETVFGKFPSTRGVSTSKGNPELEAKVSALQGQVDKLQEELQRRDNQIKGVADDLLIHLMELADHHNRLIIRIKHQHLGDFKDLMIDSKLIQVGKELGKIK